MIAAVVLAAGPSSRMGRPKPLVMLGGVPLLARVLDSVRRSTVGQLVVVLGHEADRIRREIPMEGVTVVENSEYRAGMSTSLRAGLRVVDPRADGFLIVLADQPFVSPATLDALIRSRAESDAKILIPTYRGTRGNPVLLDRSLVPEALLITGDRGCRAIFPRHEDEIVEVPVDDPGVILDLDTEEEIARAQAAVARGEPGESILAAVRR